jgi:UDP-arabinose 4-epimerase
LSKHVIVTGGAGYVGSHACKALAAAGYVPVTVDNLGNGNRAAVRFGPLVEADIRDRSAIDAAFREFKPASVMHFAAFAYVGESVRAPGPYYENNVAGTVELLEAVRAAGIANFVFSSSCATYGTPDSLPITEASAQRPTNPYGMTKLMIEHALRDYAAAYGLRFAALRYFNAAGCDVDGEIGEVHVPETHLIPNVLMAASGESPELNVFGDDYDTPDGTCIRDYVHVSDLAAAHVKALDRLCDGGDSLMVNLGTGTGYSVRQIVASVEDITGRKVPVRFSPRRPGDPAALVADASEAAAKLEFSTRRSGLKDIVSTAWAWHGSATRRHWLAERAARTD